MPRSGTILTTGRIAQKERTRREILEAAATLIAEGTVPTVSQAAERARVGRATAYRYFPTQDSLLLEVRIPLEELQAALSRTRHLGPADQMGAVVRAAADWVWSNQAVLRELLRVSLEQGRVKDRYERPSHRRQWIAEALDPLRDEWSAEDYETLAGVLTMFIGIEPVIALSDMGRLSRDQAVDALGVAATTLVANWPHSGDRSPSSK